MKAILIANQQVEIAIIIYIGEGRTGVRATVGDGEGIGANGGEGWRGGVPSVPEQEGVAVGIANKKIQIAIAIHVDQAGAWPALHGGDPEGIGAGGAVGGVGGVATIAKEQQIAVSIARGVADEEI